MKKHLVRASVLCALMLSISASPGKVETAGGFISAGPQVLGRPNSLSGRMVKMAWERNSAPIYFVPGEGKKGGPDTFYVQGKDKSLYFGPKGVTFSLSLRAENSANPEDDSGKTPGDAFEEPRASGCWNVRLEFVNSNPQARPVGEDKTGAVVSYFKGKPEEWRTGLPTFSRIVYRNLWPGIDLAYYGTVNQLKYEFVVHPGADPAQIRLRYTGAADVQVSESGQLEIRTPAGSFQDGAPAAYQEKDGKRQPVSLSYHLLDAAAGRGDETAGESGPDSDFASYSYGFDVGQYDDSVPLILDPAILICCGFIGGSGLDSASGVVVDGAGCAYITGETGSTQTTFPVTVGPDLTSNGDYDAFVAKVNASGTGLIYCGYIGGAGPDYGRGIAVDGSGNAYVIGFTQSTETTFPVASGPDLTYNGGTRDVFLAKVDAAGTGLSYCGYIGGSGDDWGRGIAIDGSGNAYATGYTSSTEADFPVSVGPDLIYNGGSNDIFVAKVDAAGTGLGYCGYIGGIDDDRGNGIAVDGAGNVYLTGCTSSTQTTFPVTVGPDLTFSAGKDGFVAKVNSTGSGLVYCGFIGGSGQDNGNGIAVDASGNAYVAGDTGSAQDTFPVSVGPDLTHNYGSSDAFVVKVNASGTGFVYGGFIGGNKGDKAYGIAVDSSGCTYVVGATNSTESTFPVSGGPDLTYNGADDIFVAKVKPSGSSLDFCGYVGGSSNDCGWSIAVDGSGGVYATGYTASTESSFPVTVGPDLTYNGGSSDVFVAKVADVPLWHPRHAAGDFDGDDVNELAVDFGASGAWMWNGGSWSLLTASNPEGMITANVDGNNDDEIAADFGSTGLWLWDGGAWTQLSGMNVECMAAYDGDSNGDDEVVCAFGAAGVWTWNGSWTQLSGVNAEYLATCDLDGKGSDEIVGDFGTTGLWLYNAGAWTQLSGINADYVTFADFNDDGVSEAIVADFGTTGLWKWSGGAWEQLSGVNADYVLIANPDSQAGEEVLGDFGATGLWKWASGTWTILSGVNAEYLVWTDMDWNWVDELPVDFGALGLWLWDAGAWTQISGVDPEYLKEADLDGDGATEMVADFGSLGLWLWDDGAWSQMSPNDPE